MDNIVRLIYALDENNSLMTVLMQGTQEEIDRFTLQFENSKELRIAFKNVIDGFRSLNVQYIESKKRVESGDIVTINGNNKRIRVLYKRHLNVFYEVINDDNFLDYLARNYTKIYDLLTLDSKYIIFSNNLIRKVYGIYKDEYKDKVRIRKQKQDNDEGFVGSLFDDSKRYGGV